MSKPVVAFAVVVVGIAGCGSTAPVVGAAGEPVSSSASAIQGGTLDTTHSFAVGVVQAMGQQIALCSGVLLAPNLVATARHCVSQLTSSQIDCATSQFTATLPPSDFHVTIQSAVPMTPSGYYSVVSHGIVVPSAPDVCGNDIALLILTSNIELPQYVVPAISPPMTDHRAYTTAYTAIGYGVDSPTDMMGASAGTRRIRQHINLSCIPQDKSFSDCYLLYPNAQQYIQPNEFEGGDGTCEGDSGSGAYDQGSFDQGLWVAFGVLSRGGVSLEGGVCQSAIYSRFDKWGSLIADTALQAAALGNYTPPSWAVASKSATADAGSSSAGGGVAMCKANGDTCNADTECCSVDCIASGDNGTFSCVACDSVKTCNTNYECKQGTCIKAPASPTMTPDAGPGSPQPHVTGCALAPGGAGWPPLRPGETLFGCAAAVAAIRRYRRSARLDDAAVRSSGRVIGSA